MVRSIGTAFLLLAFTSCQMVPRGLGVTPPAKGPYVNGDAHFSLRVPAGWETPGPGNLFKKPPYLVRFDAAYGAVSAKVTPVPLGDRSCAEAGRETVRSLDGPLLRSEKAFMLKTPAGELPAWRATFQTADGSQRGQASLFCEGSSALVLTVVADKAAYDDYESQLEAVVDSFSYYDGEREVRVRAAVVPPAPEYFRHVVTWRGQTLAQVAQWYTGKSENWTKLAAPLNEDLKAGDAPLKVGREVKIPIELVVQKEPMPFPRQPRPPASRPVARPPGTFEPGEPAGVKLPEAEAAKPPGADGRKAAELERSREPNPATATPEPEVPLPDVIGPK